MNYAAVVEVLDGQGGLVKEAECEVDGEADSGVDVKEHAAVACVLQKQVDHGALAQTVEVADAVRVV